MRGVVFVNPDSGPEGAIGADDVAEALPGWEVAAVEDIGGLQDLVRRALHEGAGSIGVAGGDGTVRCVAEVLAGTGVPLLVVPAGTRNHFACELGHDDLEAVAESARRGTVRPVSAARVNGHLFINNASIGMYPDLVRRRRRREGRRSKTVANLLAAVELVRHARPVHVEIEGQELAAWLVFVGNGRYGGGFGDLVERDSLDSGILDVRVVRADRRLARLRTTCSLAAGRLRRSKLILSSEATALTVGISGRRTDVALDGEVVVMEGPLCFEVEAGALAVTAPPQDRRSSTPPPGEAPTPEA